MSNPPSDDFPHCVELDVIPAISVPLPAQIPAEDLVNTDHSSPLILQQRHNANRQPLSLSQTQSHSHSQRHAVSNCVQSSSLSLSPNLITTHENTCNPQHNTHTSSNYTSDGHVSPPCLNPAAVTDMQQMDASIKQRNSDPFVSYALKQSLLYFADRISRSNSWKAKWSLKFDEAGLEYYFKLYFAHRFLLSNQAAFLMLSLFYIVILFIFEVQSKYEWISVLVHCILIIIIFIALILSLTDQFKVHIHRLTTMVLLLILIGLNIQSGLAEMPISAQSLLSIILVILGSASFLSMRYSHLLITFLVYFFLTNIAFIMVVLQYRQYIHYTKFTHFVWFDMLLLFAMICAAHLIRLFEIQERKLFLRILQQMQQTRQSLQRQLTVYETVSIAQLIENDRTGHDGNDVMDQFLQRFIGMGALLSHLPDIEEDSSTHSHSQSRGNQTPVAATVAAADVNECIIECEEEKHVHADIDEEEEHDNQAAKVKRKNRKGGFDRLYDGGNNCKMVHAHKQHEAAAQLCKLHRLPDYYNGYPFLTDGYRLHYTYKQAIQSVLQWHNESINMWTEIIPLFLNAFCVTFFISNDPLYAKLRLDDRLIFMICGSLILIVRPICSLLAHTFYLISKKAHDFWWRVDYTSICVTMLCEGIVSGHYTFDCNFQLKVLFFTCVSCMFISTMLSTLVSRSMQIRAASFCLLATFATGCPFLYQWIKFAQMSQIGDSDGTLQQLWEYLSLWTVSYVLAASALCIKSLWFPERCCVQHRHCLSYVGASHQIWHILINSCLSLSVYCWTVYLRGKYEGNFCV